MSTTTRSVLSAAVMASLMSSSDTKNLVLQVAKVYATKRYPVAVVEAAGKVVRVLLTKKNMKALKLVNAEDAVGMYMRFDAKGVPVRVLKNKPRLSKK